MISALFMVIFGVLKLVFGTQNEQILGAGALFLALINTAMAIGQWPELKTTEVRLTENNRIGS